MFSLISHLEQLGQQQQQQQWRHQRMSPQKDRSIKEALEQAPIVPFAPGTALISLGEYLVPAHRLSAESEASQPCVDSRTNEPLNVRVYDMKTFQTKSHLFLSRIQGVHRIRDVRVVGESVFVISGWTYGDLHHYLREKKRLNEGQAAPLFRQIVSLVLDAHSQGIALRDIKLKKFVFEDSQKTTLSLQHLDDAHTMDASGQLTERHGCPAYVCPEMLQPGNYSGKAADLWSLGVILYTLLIGRYPFFDSSPQKLFSKVRSGYYEMPENISPLARNLISSLLAHEPHMRVPAEVILEHPWFTHASDQEMFLRTHDQTVPKM